MFGNVSPRFEWEGLAPDDTRCDMIPSRMNASKKVGPGDGKAAPCPCIEFPKTNGCDDGSDMEELAAASGAGIMFMARDGAERVCLCCGAIGVGSRMGSLSWLMLLLVLTLARDGGNQGGASSDTCPPPGIV